VGTKLKFNIVFHQQTNGQTKKMNGILNHYVRNYIGDDHKDWGDHLVFGEILLQLHKTFGHKNEAL
jgi:hypothetical protein